MFIMTNLEQKGNQIYVSIIDTSDGVTDSMALFSIAQWLAQDSKHKVHGLSLVGQRMYQDSTPIGNTGIFYSWRDAKLAQVRYLTSRGYSKEQAQREVGLY